MAVHAALLVAVCVAACMRCCWATEGAVGEVGELGDEGGFDTPAAADESEDPPQLAMSAVQSNEPSNNEYFLVVM